LPMRQIQISVMIGQSVELLCAPYLLPVVLPVFLLEFPEELRVYVLVHDADQERINVALQVSLAVVLIVAVISELPLFETLDVVQPRVTEVEGRHD